MVASSQMAEPSKAIVAALAAVVLGVRAKDVRHIPRALLDANGSLNETLKVWSAAFALYGYEKVVARLLQKLKSQKVPSTLASMLSLFAFLRAIERWCGRAASDKLANALSPGVNFLGKWMGCFLAPPLVSLDASIRTLPVYSKEVWAKCVAILTLGWSVTHATAGAVASTLAPKKQAMLKVVLNNIEPKKSVTAVPSPKLAESPQAVEGEDLVKNDLAWERTVSEEEAWVRMVSEGDELKVTDQQEIVSQDEAMRRAWVVLGAFSYLGVACSANLPVVLHRPFGIAAEMSTTIGSLALCKLFPDSVQRVLHPLVICAITSNMSSRFVGDTAPYFDQGRGVGDRLFQWLNAAVTGLGVRMYNTTDLWLDDAQDFKCVLATCGVSGCMSLLSTALVVVNPSSPLSVPFPLSLPLLNRSVMSALGIEGSKAIGPECDPKLAVASILITGCIGASLGKTLLEACPAVFKSSSPVVRGVAMGCSAHSIGTAGLISFGDTQAAAISGASLCLAGTVHSFILAIPGVVPAIRSLANLPPL